MTDSSPTPDRVMIWVGMYVARTRGEIDFVASPDRDETMALAEALFHTETTNLRWQNYRDGVIEDGDYGPFHLRNGETMERAQVQAVPLMKPGALFRRGIGDPDADESDAQATPVDPPAAHICERCGHADKITEIPAEVGHWWCPRCKWHKYRVDSWANVEARRNDDTDDESENA